MNIFVHRVGVKGGAQLVMKKVVEVLDKLRDEFDLYIVCSLDGIDECKLCDEVFNYNQLLPSSFGDVVSNLLLQRKLSSKHFDIVITHSLLPPNLVNNSQYTITFDGRDWSDFIKTRNLVGKLVEYIPWRIREVQYKNSVIFLINPENRDYYFRLHPQKVFFVPNGVDVGLVSSIPPVPKVYDFGFLGRFSPEKNPYLVMEAFKNTRFSGIMIGANDNYKVGNIYIKKFMKRKDALREIKKARIGILPSLHEGFPLVLLEFLVLGIPVIVSDSVKTPVDTFVIKFKCCDRDSLLSTFLHVYDNYPYYQKKALKNRRIIIKKFNWEKTLESSLRRVIAEVKMSSY
ncbi:glycosyltransferase family 4 protein [Thermococcus gorgonarius]|uniref:Glycosyl transferase family 1 domain-containing protein n=1 Tax=Thermococcus gorgonarius TaxID=71997 RepID=A0A2Z2M6N7_THEGO|nr:glycosyltransferase family 4 protein [Thermococcus gorgonarius]ASI99974.1 hypothetical protein A3K92_00010 [Thermococcus gorgonarius]